MSGWGRFTWGQAYWGEDQTLATGWGAKSWGTGEWGNLADETVTLTGQSISSNVGSITVTGTGVVDLVGVETTSNVGSLTITANADVLPSGVSFTGNVGSLTTEIGVGVELTGQEIASALGVITPADQVMGLTGLEFNVEQGTAVAPNEDVSLTGVEFTSALGTPTIDVVTVVEPTGLEITSEQGTAIAPNNSVTLQGQESEFTLGQLVGLGSSVVNLEGQSVTSTVGSIDPADQVMGLTGVSFSSSVGSISVEDQVVGLQGFEITASVGAPFIIHYQDVDTGSNTNYSGVSTGSNTSYSNVATGSNTSYSDAAQEIKFMASTYNELGIELMATGENAGTWGTKTNTNLDIIQQAIAGYVAQAVTDGGTTALTITDGSTSTSVARNIVIKLTGALTGTSTVTVPDSVEKLYIVENATTGSQTVTFKTASGTGVNFTSTGFKFLYSDGTNINEITLASPPGGSDTQIQFNSGGTAFGGSANLVWDGSNVTIGAQGDLRLADTTGGEYVGLQAPGTVSASYTLTFPAATGSADQILVTDGSGNLSFADNSGGTSWQAVKTTGFTAVAGEGYFINTTSGAITMTLPASPTIGDEVSFVDYAGTFDTNNLTIGRNSENIQGSAADLTVSVERAANTLVYTDGTQGWLLTAK